MQSSPNTARVIARLDVKGENVVKGIQFEALRVMGQPSVLADEYFAQGADELIYIDIVASLYQRDSLLHIVREASRKIHIPFTAGGGVRSIDDIRSLLQAGADKVALNTAATKHPELIAEAARLFGSQCIVVSIEAKRRDGGWEAYTDNGREPTGLDVVAWAQKVQDLGAGEILLTSVDQEGTSRGLDIELVKAVSSRVTIPVIASGGAASPEDVATCIASTNVDAVAVASMLHYGRTNIAEIKDALASHSIPIRPSLPQERERRLPSDETSTHAYNQFTLRQFNDTHPTSSENEQLLRPAAEADVSVINYEINNVRSVVTALESLGKSVAVVQTPEEIQQAKRLILPGVGAFKSGMNALNNLNLVEALLERVSAGTPLLGICLGMQLLFSESEEFGVHKGLNLVPGKIVSFPSPDEVDIPGYHLPHIGWRTLKKQLGSDKTIVSSLDERSHVYFVHSYYPIPENPAVIAALATYGGIEFCAVLEHNNVSATQFHPEKSGQVGFSILNAFCEKVPL